MVSNSSQFVFKLLLSGFGLIFLGIILIVIASVFSDGSVNLGGIIVIGPIPIIFGAGENAWLMILIATILAIACLILFLLLGRQKQGGL
jgi:uncharacterized membrane protein